MSREPNNSDSQSHKTQLLIAIISLVGVLGSTLIANWEKIFPLQSTENTVQIEGKPGERELENSVSIPNRVFRLSGGKLELSNVNLTPASPAQILEREKVSVTFDYKICCNANLRIWIKPKIVGSNCRYRYSPSPVYSDIGRDSGFFDLLGSECSSAQIDGLRIVVKNIATERRTNLS